MVVLDEELYQRNIADRIATIESHIKYTDRKIDELVYKLYGLNEEDI